ncbi:ATP-binding cassette domain-containing protein [Arthrobacter sp. FW306-04-A]|nr:ATP-binding cassette domain-containing protein [Arthrobacter sp. FW306-04-A]
MHKSFGKVHAVRGLDLTVQPGEVVAFLGPNGAGKTTTIDMILGLSAPDQGSVSIFGHTPRGAIARGQVAAVMQTGGLLRDISVRETVQLNAAMFDSSRPVDEVLARAGILEIADRKRHPLPRRSRRLCGQDCPGPARQHRCGRYRRPNQEPCLRPHRQGFPSCNRARAAGRDAARREHRVRRRSPHRPHRRLGRRRPLLAQQHRST